MGINKYKVYPASSLPTLDMTKVEENIRWNKDGTEFIVEFAVEPHGNTVTLNREEADAVINTKQWQYDVDESGDEIIS